MVFRQLPDDAPGFFFRPYNSVTDGVQRKGKYSKKVRKNGRIPGSLPEDPVNGVAFVNYLNFNY